MKLLVSLFLLVLSGCQLFGSNGTGRDVIELEAQFKADQTRVELVLTNRTDRAIGFNLCLSAIENQSTEQRYYDPLIDCQSSLDILQAREDAEMTLSFGATDPLPIGLYRAVTTVEVDRDPREIKSATFAIR